MDCLTARLIVLPTVAIGSAWLVARYKAKGGVGAVLLGWLILGIVYNAWPAPAPEWDEDREEIWMSAPVLMTIWCTIIWTAFKIGAWVKRRGKWGTSPTKPDSPT